MDFSYAPWIWIMLTILFAVVEAIIPVFVSGWFATGAFVALLSSILHAPVSLQIGLFLAVSFLVLIFLRPTFYAFFKNKRKLPSNIEAYIGKTATVIQDIIPPSCGRVQLDGVDWNARCNVPLKTSDLCIISAVQGTTLIVQSFQKN